MLRVLALLCLSATALSGPVCTSQTVGSQEFRGISGSSDTDIIGVGKKGTIYHYDGTAWSAMTNPGNKDLNDVEVVDDSNAFTVGKDGETLQLTGGSWVSRTGFSNDDLFGVWAASATEAWVVGEKGTIFFYDGVTWTDQSTAAGTGNEKLKDAWGTDSSFYAMGDKGKLYRFDRNTSTWASPDNLCDFGKGFEDLWGDSAGNIYLVKKKNVYRHDGAGCSLVASASENLKGVYGAGSEVYAGGKKGVVLHFDGSTWQESTDADEEIKDVWVSTAGNAYFAGKKAEITSCAAGGIDHFFISHDGSGIHCQLEPVTVAVHDIGHGVVTGYAGVVSLSTTTSHGDWSLITGSGTLTSAGGGAGTYAFDTADNGVVVLGLRNTFTETTNINVTDGGAIEDSGEDADLVYASAGFNFLADATKNTIGTQIGGKASNLAPEAQTLELQAVRTNDDTGACEAALTGTNTIELAFECENPSTCTANQVAISGTNVAGNPNASVSSYTNISLDFGDATDSTATFTLSYPDVGQLQMHARLTLSPSVESMLGASNSFVVRPFALHVTATGNPAATGPAGAVFTSAGTNFTSTARAVLWSAGDDTDNNGIADNHDDADPSNNVDLSNNAAALNYGRESSIESVSLSAALDQPVGGSDPGLSGGTTVGVFASGSGSTATTRYDEVGIIEMSAAIADGDYLGIGAPTTANIVGKSGYVGRFNPARYAVTMSNIVPACASTFTYARQPFNGSLTLQAQNGTAGGNLITSNYRAGFVTLDPATELVIVNDQTGGSYDLQTIAFTQDFDTGTTGEAVFALQFRWDMAQQAPVVSTAQLTGVTDEVSVIAGAPADIGFSTMRYGRIAMTDALGSELVNLAVPMRAEYYLDANTDFVPNTDDSCSSAVTLSFSNFAGNLIAGDTCVLDNGSPGDSGAGCVVPGPVAQQYNEPPITGDFNLFLQAPGNRNDGSLSVDAVVPDWLKFDWDTGTAGDENPSARATFGIYDGGEEQIYRRELY